jgi:hypothetical protein
VKKKKKIFIENSRKKMKEKHANTIRKLIQLGVYHEIYEFITNSIIFNRICKEKTNALWNEK